MVKINKIGIEDLEKLRKDSTMIKTNIHYPINNSLIWDFIKENYRLLNDLNEISTLGHENYRAEVKKTYFRINDFYDALGGIHGKFSFAVADDVQ